jgi:hypothetical protein
LTIIGQVLLFSLISIYKLLCATKLTHYMQISRLEVEKDPQQAGGLDFY